MNPGVGRTRYGQCLGNRLVIRKAFRGRLLKKLLRGAWQWVNTITAESSFDMDRQIIVSVRIAVCVILLGIIPKGWAFTTEGVINADFSYRNLQLIEDKGTYFLSGLLKNRSDRAYLGILIVFGASDCVTGRTKWKSPFYIDSIDPEVELPFKIQVVAAESGNVCKFRFRTGYQILPVKPAPVLKKDPSPAHTSVLPIKTPPSDQTVYAWIDGHGVIHYSSVPPESRLQGMSVAEDDPGAEPIYTWVDRQGVTRYSDTLPEASVLRERHHFAMQSADNIAAYLTAMHQWVWAHWLHPLDAPNHGVAFKASVRFHVLPDGRIRKIRIEKSSGVDALDESFYNAVAKSDPLPPLPARFKDSFYDAMVVFTSKRVK